MDVTRNGPNADQIEYWNETVAQKWVSLAPRIDAQIRCFGVEAMDRAAVVPGERILDVGCGCGDTVIGLARRAAPGGHVTGIDISAPMLAEAARRVRQHRLANVELRVADAQTEVLPGAAFDLVFSRFGVMFFADPPQAFANLRRSLRPDGRLAFVCWRALEENPWMALPLAAVAQVIDLPPAPPPESPGPFSLADARRLRSILESAGYGEIRIEPVDREVQVGGTGDLGEAVDFLLRMGPAGRVLRESPPEVAPRVAQAVRAAIAPFFRPGGSGVRMPAAAWVVVARP